MPAAAGLSPAWAAVAPGLRRLEEPPELLLAWSRPEQVAAVLVEHVPELASGALTLTDLEVVTVRIKENARRALYRAAVADAGGRAEQRDLRLRGELLPPGQPAPRAGLNGIPFGREGWRCYLPELRLDLAVEPPEDRALPALRLLTDPAAARDLLERELRRASPRYARIGIEACRPHVMRYKPGSRCTVLYELRYAGNGRGAPDVVVAKTYHSGKGRTAFEGMRALRASALNDVVTLAEPLTFLPELNVLLQTGVPHALTLKELVKRAIVSGNEEAMTEVSAYVAKTAPGLAGVHSSGVRAPSVFTWDDQLAEIRAVVVRLAGFEPSLAEALAPLLDHIEALAAEHPAQPLVPAHGSFRPAQVLLNAGDIAFIDFDSFCLAEPALDLALFCATLKDSALHAVHGEARDALPLHLAVLEELRDRFLRGYEAAAAVSRPRVALWETLHLLTAVLHCWTKAKFDRLEERLQLLRDHLRRSELTGASA
jgi:thiamine kinase-like enzyme